MRNYRILMVSVAMLMASMSLMAQRVTTTLKGTGQVGMYGFPCTITITPDGDGVIIGKATKEVGTITVKFKAEPHILFEMPTVNGGKGFKGDGFQWAYIKDVNVYSFTMLENKVKANITPKGKGKINGTTSKDQAKFYVRFPISSGSGQSALDINFTFELKNVVINSYLQKEKTQKGLDNVIR